MTLKDSDAIATSKYNVTSVTMKTIQRKDLFVTLYRSIKQSSSKVGFTPILSWMESLMVLWRQSKNIKSATLARAIIQIWNSSSSLNDQWPLAYGLDKIIQCVWKACSGSSIAALYTYVKTPSSSCSAANRRTATKRYCSAGASTNVMY